jgi:predicted ABC-type ATPase
MAEDVPCIYVIAGTNGAGKSSIAGAAFREKGVEYFNPDEAAKRIRSANPSMTQNEANSAAWNQGKRLLERAIAERGTFAFETPLGGRTMTGLLERALSEAMEVRIWYVGLANPELHIARVKAQVARGGHHVSESIIRERFNNSRLNLIRLLPGIAELRLYDNTEEGDPSAGRVPKPKLLLYLIKGKIDEQCSLTETPAWAKPIVAAVLKAQTSFRK